MPWPTGIRPAASTPSAGRTWESSSPPAPPSSPPSTGNTSRRRRRGGGPHGARGGLQIVRVRQEGLSGADREILEQNLNRAREGRAHIAVLEGKDPVAAILRFAAAHGIPQIFVGHSQQTGWRRRFRANLVERLILGADGIHVRIFPRE